MGNPLVLPATLTAAMLATGEVGFLSDAPPSTEFGIVFSVSDGQLASSHSVLAVEVVAPSDSTPGNGSAKIELGRLSGPTIVLADGYSPSATQLPPESIVNGWLNGDFLLLRHCGPTRSVDRRIRPVGFGRINR